MVLKYSFKLFFLKCIFELKINKAPQGSNSVDDREKSFNAISLKLCSGRMAQWYMASLFALEEEGVQVQIPLGLLPAFFLSSYFYPLACFCLLSLLTLFSFARFFR